MLNMNVSQRTCVPKMLLNTYQLKHLSFLSMKPKRSHKITYLLTSMLIFKQVNMKIDS